MKKYPLVARQIATQCRLVTIGLTLLSTVIMDTAMMVRIDAINFVIVTLLVVLFLVFRYRCSIHFMRINQGLRFKLRTNKGLRYKLRTENGLRFKLRTNKGLLRFSLRTNRRVCLEFIRKIPRTLGVWWWKGDLTLSSVINFWCS